MVPSIRASTTAGPTRPRWMPRVSGGSNQRPSTTPTPSKTRTTDALTSDHGQSFESAIAKALHHERDARGRLMKQIEDAQRIEDQRVYHAQLASENRKRRDRRRAQRESASRQRQEAAAERKMESVKVAMRQTATPETDFRDGNARTLAQKNELLAWERTVDAAASGSGQRIHRQRPKWVAQPVWSASQQQEGGHREQSNQLAVLRDCQSLLDSIQRARDRRERLLAEPSPSSIAVRMVRPETAPA